MSHQTDSVKNNIMRSNFQNPKRCHKSHRFLQSEHAQQPPCARLPKFSRGKMSSSRRDSRMKPYTKKCGFLCEILLLAPKKMRNIGRERTTKKVCNLHARSNIPKYTENRKKYIISISRLLCRLLEFEIRDPACSRLFMTRRAVDAVRIH